MKMLKVDNFFGCMSLETGGLVIGWFNVIGNVLAILLGASIVFILCLWNCDDLKNAVDENGDPVFMEYEKAFCSFTVVYMIAFGVLLIIFGIGFLVIACFCIKGTYRRNHSHVKPMTVLMGVVTVLAFIQMFYAFGLFQPLKVILYAYQFIVMYSLYTKFRDEFETRAAIQYYAPMEKI